MQNGEAQHSLAALRRRLESLLGEDALDGGAIDLVAEIAECVAQPGIAPARILAGKLDDQLLNPTRGRRPTGTAPARAVVLGGNELSIPAQDCVRRQTGW